MSTSSELLALVYEVRFELRRVLQEYNELKEQNEKLRQLAACAYQFAGAHDAPVEWLDALSNAADGRPFDTSKLLPYDGGNTK